VIPRSACAFLLLPFIGAGVEPSPHAVDTAIIPPPVERRISVIPGPERSTPQKSPPDIPENIPIVRPYPYPYPSVSPPAPWRHVAMAAMLATAEPGISDGSRVESAPGRDGEAPGFSLMGGRVTWDTWTRRESRMEALARWATIARAIELVALQPPAAWRGSPLQLTRALVTIARHESAYWRSVHDGSLRGEAGEACLVQVHPEAARALDVELEELVGLSKDATTRCLRAGAALLGRARNQCPSEGGHWFSTTIVGYWQSTCRVEPGHVEGVEARERTYVRTGARSALPDDARAVLQ
jgi:hypothetical protein